MVRSITSALKGVIWLSACVWVLRLFGSAAFRIAAFVALVALSVPLVGKAQQIITLAPDPPDEVNSCVPDTEAQFAVQPVNNPHESRPEIGFPFLRYDEDWAFLRDPSRRTEFWDRLKYLPLNRMGSAYVSLGGESRQVFEWYRNQYWGDGPQDDNGWLTQRYMAHADMHLGARFRVFGQLQLHWRMGVAEDRARTIKISSICIRLLSTTNSPSQTGL